MKETRGQVLLGSLQAALGLFGCGFSIYLTMQANIGLGPWEVFNMGLSYHFPLSYGDVAMIVSFVIVAVNLLLRERIGVGTILDALIVGKSADLFMYLDLIPAQDNPVTGVLMMVLGMFIMAFTQYIYMSAALCCGPRDSLLVALGRRVRRMPIGYVNIILQLAVLAIGWALGGPVGIGTIISAFGLGATMQLTFRCLKFDPRDIRHQDLLSSARLLLNGKPRNAQI